MASDALLAVSARLTGCRRLLAAFWGGTELGLDGGWTEEVLFVGVGSMYVYKFWTRLVIHFCGNALGHSLAISATEFNELVIPWYRSYATDAVLECSFRATKIQRKARR